MTEPKLPQGPAHTTDEPVDERDKALPNQIEPLSGEPGIPDVAARAPTAMSRKGLFGLALMVVSVVTVSAFSIQRYVTSGPPPEPADAKTSRDRPAATVTAPRQLDLGGPLYSPASAPSQAASAPRIPAILANGDERAEAIGVRRTTSASGPSAAPKSPTPEDAPVLLASSRPGTIAQTSVTTEPSSSPDPLAATQRNLQAYQSQLQGLMDTLSRTAAASTRTENPNAGVPTSGPVRNLAPIDHAPSRGTHPPGGQLQGSATPRVSATLLGDRSLTLPKGTAFTCALKTRVISATSGLVGCQVQRNVYSDNGRVLLIERGSHLDGEYRIASVKPGTVRIPVLWTRIRTPLGVTVDLDSPGTGQLGESGIDGYVDNRWGERLGAAMLLSLIDDSVKLVIQQQSGEGAGNGGSTVVLPSTTAQTSKLAEKVLESTINIPPLIYQNQGGLVGIYVARDVDFSSVYELRPEAGELSR